MQIAFLGTGNAFVPQRDWSCILVNGTLLLDAGPTVLPNLKRLGADPAAIRHIFISHFHGDHFFGLPFLLLEYHFASRTDAPLAVIGPAGIEDRVTAAMALAYPDIAALGWPRPLHFVEATPGTTQTVDGVTFATVEMEHGDASIAAYGYRLYLEDGILAYSGDTRVTPALDALVQDARAVILEATVQESSDFHLGRAALAALLARIPAQCTVFVTHLDVADSAPWEDLRVLAPDDLQTYTLDAVPTG